MIRNIILAFFLINSLAQFSNAQKFDPEKYQEMREQTRGKFQSISEKASGALMAMQDHIQNNNYEEALKTAEQIDIEDFNYTELGMYYQLQASIYSQQDDLLTAVEFYERILELQPTSVSMYTQILLVAGQIHIAEGNHEKGLDYLDRHFTYSRSPKFSQYQIAFGSALTLKDYERANNYIDIAEEGSNENEEMIERYKITIANMRTMAANSAAGVKTGSDGNDAASNHDYKIVVGVTPVYPEQAAEKKTEGWVLLSFDIDNNGNAINLGVAESTNKIFERAALDAAADYQFEILRNADEDGYLLGNIMRIDFSISEDDN